MDDQGFAQKAARGALRQLARDALNAGECLDYDHPESLKGRVAAAEATLEGMEANLRRAREALAALKQEA